ncbi:hypothetical protein [Hafnia alvei]|uniref:hypothetical protein n=1 Tax=Hafnia alvei TaxID=569 RepID=UPI00345C906E
MGVIKNHRQIREYKKCLDHIVHEWNRAVSDNDMKQLVSRGDYYKLARAIVNSLPDKEKIKEAETLLAAVVNNELLPEVHFNGCTIAIALRVFPCITSCFIQQKTNPI